MEIMVQKFGGSSVATRERMQLVQGKVSQALAKGAKVIVVLSARQGDTNNLLTLAGEWSQSPDPAELDVLVSTGEQVSIALFTMMLIDAGIKARSFLAHQLNIHTDFTFGKARIQHIDNEHLAHHFANYDVLVVAGFQGCTEDNRITTLGRGGSDTTAVALAAAANASVCEIYTDVEGVYTTDPNLCQTARKLDVVSYEEMLEMASMGAKVLEIRSVEFAKKYNVPLLVRSTFSQASGTLVTHEDKTMEHIMVSSIAYDRDQARITITAVEDKPGVASAIFGPLASANVSVDVIVQNPSKDGVTDMNFTVSRKDLQRTLDIVEETRKHLGNPIVEYDANVSKISAIGVGMRNHSGVAAKMFAALRDENINILMISTSEIKISCVIEEKYTELAVRVLHNTFGLDKQSYLED